MSLELRGRPASPRCPYCHDQLELPDLAPITCPGCGTAHHQVCLDELGGCAVQGCRQASAPPPAADSVEAIRSRIRERAQRYARNQARLGRGAPPTIGPRYDPGHKKDLLLTLQELLTASPNCPLILVVGFCLLMLAIVLWAALTGA